MKCKNNVGIKIGPMIKILHQLAPIWLFTLKIAGIENMPHQAMEKLYAAKILLRGALAFLRKTITDIPKSIKPTLKYDML